MIQKLNSRFGKRPVDIALITLGSIILGAGFNAFLLPNRIVSGGINGLTIILHELFNLSPSLILYAVNGVLLILCYVLLGKAVLMKSILGSLLVPFFISLFHSMGPATHDPILASIFGGVSIGLGVGLVFLGNGSTGGTTLISLIIQKYTQLKLSILLAVCDGLVILSALFVFDIQTVLYALISLFLTSRMVDLVQVGPDLSKNLFIISNQYDQIRVKLVQELGYGVTFVPIEGGLNQDYKKMIMAVIREEQFIDIKQEILDIDPEAFIVITSANEVVGKGFTIFE
ncbi:MAG: YitT family protein [Vagococcus sp.]